MAKWEFTREGTYRYPTLGFTASTGDVVEADIAPDAWWDEVDGSTAVTIPVTPIGGATEPAQDAIQAYNRTTNRGQWKTLSELGLLTAAEQDARYASQLDITGLPTATINAWLATASALGVKRMVGAATISAPLTVVSDTRLDALGAHITAGFDGNILRNEHYASGDRDTNITIIGGTWDRAARGGSNNDAHSIFIRRVDGIHIEQVTYLSEAGKYGIALGDISDYTLRDIRSTCASDTIHITGPAYDGVIDGVRNSGGGDDVVAFTTTDYTAYDDVHGPIAGVSVRNVSGTTSTRIVLIGGTASGVADGYDISGIVVEDVVQHGTGHSVWTGSTAADAAQIVDLTVRRASGGQGVNLRHHRHGAVTLETITAAAGSSPVSIGIDSAGSNVVTNLTVSKATHTGSTAFLSVNNANITVGTVTLDGVTCTGAGAMVSAIAAASFTALVLRGCRYAGSNDVLTLGGTYTLGQVTFSDSALTTGAGKHVMRLSDTITVAAIAFSRCTIGAADTSSGIMVYKGSTGPVLGSINVDGCDLNAIGRILEVASGSSGTVALNVANTDVTGCNRIAQVGGGTLNFIYANVSGATVNEPIRVYNGTAANIRGAGWGVKTSSCVVRASAEVIHVLAQDFPADVSILTKANGDAATNTNAGLACGAGRVISDGSAWKNVYSGATY
ncbi:hypothetical protein [Demequina gelatinilytica]|uniref:hypothetical protein n=1 Tax=Demequina gelatinilytica TaxID=1638980 RepID=UPI00078137D0|nr:hypothetical protein [Demequina gelatinilytica]